jgi:2-polyprenyl-3-methyl-5-hydroxy-6-metoxy-1,4-benzoquinol methylase
MHSSSDVRVSRVPETKPGALFNDQRPGSQRPHALDFSSRAELTERMDEPCTRAELRGCLRDIARLNRWTLAYRPLLAWLDAVAPPAGVHPIHILDVGCGYGDTLRRVEHWAQARRRAVELTGLDIHADTIAIAAEATPKSSVVRWVCSDVFAYQSEKPVHIIISSLFTHHLRDADVVRFLGWMERNAEAGWFVSDLCRAAIPYRLCRLLVKLARLHPFVQNDAPVSIARSFVADDWRRMCAATGLDEASVSVRACRPARICTSRRMTP